MSTLALEALLKGHLKRSCCQIVLVECHVKRVEKALLGKKVIQLVAASYVCHPQ